MAPKRAYVSPLREKTAAQTRAQILEEAEQLFADRGYGRVTVTDIASAAGVASKTVFASVGSKADIMDKIVQKAIVRSGYKESVAHILATRTPKAVLEALAHGTRAGNEGQFKAHEAIHKALPVHENGEALWEKATAAYRGALRDVAQHLLSLSAPPHRYSVEETADLLWFWFGPTGWRTLVVENGWSWDRAEEVLYRTAVAALTENS